VHRHVVSSRSHPHSDHLKRCRRTAKQTKPSGHLCTALIQVLLLQTPSTRHKQAKMRRKLAALLLAARSGAQIKLCGVHVAALWRRGDSHSDAQRLLDHASVASMASRERDSSAVTPSPRRFLVDRGYSLVLLRRVDGVRWSVYASTASMARPETPSTRHARRRATPPRSGGRAYAIDAGRKE
jgi:hypothetical protein